MAGNVGGYAAPKAGGGSSIPTPVSLANGGTGSALADPNADRILFWDDSAGAFTFLVASTGLTITGTNLTASGATVADADYGDVTVSSTGTVWTIDAGVVSNAKLRNSGACSVIGRNANSTGVPADISASEGEVLRRVSNVLGFGTVTSAGIAAGAVGTSQIASSNVTYAKIQDAAACSILGRAGNSVGAMADIAAGEGEVLRRASNVVGFGTILSAGIASQAVTYAKIQNVAANSVIGRAANSAGVSADISATEAAGAGLLTFNDTTNVIGFYQSTSAGTLVSSGPVISVSYEIFALTTVTLATLLDATHSTVLVNNSSDIVIDLPTAAGITGKKYVIKKISNNANTVTIDASSAQTIDGATTVVLNAQYQSREIISNGSNWFVISQI